MHVHASLFFCILKCIILALFRTQRPCNLNKVVLFQINKRKTHRNPNSLQGVIVFLSIRFFFFFYRWQGSILFFPTVYWKAATCNLKLPEFVYLH